MPAPDGRTLDATVITTDQPHDLAVIRVDATGLPTVAIGNSNDLQLGQQVVALGYALALKGGPTVTSGIVSSLDRTIQVQDPNTPSGSRTYDDVLQTDAAINPGNSGGPLIDLSGHVVGIDSAGSSQAENIGFAIAIDAAKPPDPAGTLRDELTHSQHRPPSLGTGGRASPRNAGRPIP